MSRRRFGLHAFTLLVVITMSPLLMFGQVTPPQITTTALPAGLVGVPYSFGLTATGGLLPYTWNASGLPPGLSISLLTGVISGTPTTNGSFQVSVTLRDLALSSDTKTFAVVISPFSISTPSLANGTIGVSYEQTLTATGGTSPITWSVEAGSLPQGLTFTSSGTISGTPVSVGTSPVSIRATDNASRTADKNFSIIIAPPISISTTSLPDGVAGTAYSQALAATGGIPPYTWSLLTGSLPQGLSLSNGGVISGTPSAAGNSSFRVEVTDNDGDRASRQFSITVVPAPLIITTASLPSGIVGTQYATTLAASGGIAPYVWSVSGTPQPPTGLALSGTGTISGTPLAGGASTFTVQVSDSSGRTASRAFTITIENPDVGPGGVSVTTSALPSGMAGLVYATALSASGGTPPYSWTLAGGTLPPGLTLSSAGVISGTPTQAGSFNLSVGVQDNLGSSALRPLSLIIVAGGSNPVVLSGVPPIMNPTQQAPVALARSASGQSSISGTLTVVFTANAVVNRDDPAVRFSNGSRSVRFSIANNSSSAVFDSPAVLLTGTVAGTLTFHAAIDGSPGAVQVGSALIQPLSPQFTDISATRSTGSLQVQVTGYSPERRVSIVEFTFDIRVEGGTERVVLTRNVEIEFDRWYRSAGSAAFGSTFLFVQTFAVDGDGSAIEAVTIRLTNGQGIGLSPRAVVGN